MTHKNRLVATTNPELEEIWSPNNTIAFSEIKENSAKIAKWICPVYNLEYEREIRRQVKGTRKSPYVTGRKVVKGVNDIFTTHPWLEQIWNFELNEVDPETISKANQLKIWWTCPETKAPYQRLLKTQIEKGLLSPYITSTKVLQGHNDLETVHPEIVNIWDYSKNEDTPSDVLPLSHKKRWWKLPTGDSVEKEIRIIVESLEKHINLTTLGTAYPEVFEIWDFDKNKQSPDDYLETSNEKVWVKGQNGETVLRDISYIKSRAKASRVSKIPEYQKVSIPNKTTEPLQKTHPHIAKMWNTERNNLSPLEVTAGQSKEKFWWVCPDTGTHYLRSIRDQVKAGERSPYMSGKVILPGYNDLATLRPEVIQAWSAENEKQPNEITRFSDYRAILIDENGENFERSAGGIYLYGTERKEKGRSLREIEILEHISSSSSKTVIENDYSVLETQEIDILVQEARLGFEYNGLYWHSDKRKLSPRYHYDKWADALEAGYDLIHVWEDEFQYVKKQTLLRVSQFLSFRGCLEEKAFPVTSVRIVTPDDVGYANELFDRDVSGNQNCLGLFSGDELVALVTCYFEGSSLYLKKLHLFNVFADVNGVFVNFLKQLSVSLNVSSVRVELSNGSFPLGVLLDAGFEVVQELSPSYLYHYSRRRLSEDEVVERGVDCDSLPKIWDAGRSVLELSFS